MRLNEIMCVLLMFVGLCCESLATGDEIKPTPATNTSVYCCEQCEKRIADLELRVAELEMLLKPTAKPVPEFNGLGNVPLPDPPAGKMWKYVPQNEFKHLPVGTVNSTGCIWNGRQWVCPRKGK